MIDENATPAETPALEPAAAAPAPPKPRAKSTLPETAEYVPLSDADDTAETAGREESPVEDEASESDAPSILADTTVGSTLPKLEAQAAALERHAESQVEPLSAAESESPAVETPPAVDPEAVEAAPASAAEAVEPAAPVKKKRTRKAAAESAPDAAAGEPAAEAKPAEGETGRKWYVVKIQSGREETIKAAIERKVKIEGLEEFFGRIEIPVEEMVEKKKVKAKVKDKKTGDVDTVYQEKNVTKKRKKYPGYLFAEVDFNDRILYLFRETSGVGDFVGATLTRAPNPMPEYEVQAMLTGVASKGGPPAGKVKVKLDYEKGDKVKVRDGAFSGMEGEVKNISEAKDASETPKVKVEVTIFGRPVEVELDYWQVDKA